MSNEMQIDCKVHMTAQYRLPPEDNQEQIMRNQFQLKLDEWAQQEQDRIRAIMVEMVKEMEASANAD